MASDDYDRERLAREKRVAYGESNVAGIVIGMFVAAAILALAFFAFYDRNPPSGSSVQSSPPTVTAPGTQQKTTLPPPARDTTSPAPSKSGK